MFHLSTKTNQKNQRGSEFNRCCFTNDVCPGDSNDDNNEENNDDSNIENGYDNNKINDTNNIEFNNDAQTFFEKYTEYLQKTYSFSKKKEKLETAFKLLEAKKKITLAEKNHSDVAQYAKEFDELQSQADEQKQQEAQEKLDSFNLIQKIRPPKYSNPTNIDLLMKYIEGEPQMNAGVPRENKKDLDDNVETQNVSKGHNRVSYTNNKLYHPICVSDSNEYPCIKIASEEIRPEKYVHDVNLRNILTNICFKIIAFD